jgi:hypothetical protein
MWNELKTALEQWVKARDAATLEQQRLYAEQTKKDIIKELNGLVSITKNKNPLSPLNKEEIKNPMDGLAHYTSSVIIDEEGSGLKTTHTIKINDPMKKDETTGMELGKIAKAIEFGTRQFAPHPAWRRALSKLKTTGIYKKDS